MRDGCAARSKACDEPLHGTASRARRWILFEHPGAWGADVLADTTLPPAIGERLRGWSRDVPARVLLIRRAPGVPREVPHRSLYVGVTTLDAGWFERLDLARPDEVLDLDLTALGEERRVGGEPVTEPFYLVCTNGKHDACCAELGRPVVDVLAPRLGERLWECSHVGGDRFAGNLVCLPRGVMYGHLDASTAAAAVDVHEAGVIDLDRWRGRTALPFAVQSAEALARRALGLTDDGDLRWTGADTDGDETTARFVRRDGTSIVVRVRRTSGSVPRNLTCAGAAVLPPVHELVSLHDG